MTISQILGPERISKGLFWTKAWSLVSGCTPVSPGCLHCWLADMAYRFPQNYPPDIVNKMTYINPGQDIRKGAAYFTGKIVTHPERLEIPLKTRKPQVFAIWSDLFHEGVDIGFLTHVMDTIEQCPQHIFLAITKRPERILPMLYGKHGCNLDPEGLKGKHWRYFGEGDFHKNLYYLFTAENQEQADKRLPIALQIPAAKRLVLYEPALGPLDLIDFLRDGIPTKEQVYGPRGLYYLRHGAPRFDGVIAGGETGPHARPSRPDFFRKVRDDCQAAGVPFFLKHVSKTAGRLLDGRTWDELPP